ncbi:helicase C-terminal domain-containing protein [Pyrobaculum neutrophilum]|uniref:Helicase C2 n=1 Tax=Pyrobaculum neutrophilum (strain DSM 2338 / JCM 9278 / NBRC 100436 / V24Sta) TaxID=444157 RepID=B1YDF7_PYRNV|nr:helicase C-terminal domain-containing protein [Pyrobaculum neutrophilum]ACB39820.1 helicase C2 [Pyrobaculum neutrophilum V24Sta]
MRIVVNAPPGYGKSRRIAAVAAGRRKALVFVKSHLEGLQMAKYVEESGGRAGLLFGRRSLCPLGAENAYQCLRLREQGVCKARSGRVEKLIFDVERLYKMGVCPYEAVHVAGRRANVVVLPLAYLSKVSNLAAVADLLEEADLVALDEAHNLLAVIPVRDEELYSRRYCLPGRDAPMCLALPLVGEVVRRARGLIAASASILRRFSSPFTQHLSAQFVEVRRLPGEENLEVDFKPLEFRYRTRMRDAYVEAVAKEVRRLYETYGRVAVFLPNKELASYYMRRLGDVPASDKPLGDIDHVIVTYYGSPVSEGVNLDVKAGVLVGFPIPNIKSRELWLMVEALNRLGYDGYRYAVLFTAVNHVIQAAGRVMRNLQRERKYILLMDDRFTEYKHLLPSYISKAL